MNKYFQENDDIMNQGSKENTYAYIAPKEEAVNYDDTYDVGEDLALWIDSISDYVLKNIRVCRKYMDIEQVKEYRLVCEYSGRCALAVQGIFEDGHIVGVSAENISGELVSEDNRDEYKDVLYAGEIVWPEFCQYVKKESRETVMESVCRRLEAELGCAVRK